MRYLHRILQKTLVALSLILCIAMIVFWVRSYGAADGFSWARARVEGGEYHFASVQLICMEGRVWFKVERTEAQRLDSRMAQSLVKSTAPMHGKVLWGHSRFPRELYKSHPLVPETAGWGPLRWRHYVRGNRTEAWSMNSYWLDSAAWLLVIVLGIVPSLWVGRFIRGWIRQSRGYCAACGYDTRATPQRCPECGAKIKSPLSSSENVAPLSE